jgi:hypothetical protein
VGVAHHFVRDREMCGDIKLGFVGTEDQLADMFTKALTGPKLEECQRRMGMGPRE